MKVTFSCEKCGREYEVPIESWTYGSPLPNYLTVLFKESVAPPQCPYCSKLTYGPLTEELVAEALAVAAYPDDYGPDQWHATDARSADRYRRQARAVIRLLDAPLVECRVRDHDDLGRPLNIREWLLSLARKP